MRNLSILCAITLLAGSQQATGGDIGGVDIAETITPQGSESELVLNGAGIRKKFFMDIYVGALYLPARNTDAGAIISDTGAASVDMHIVYKEIDRQKLTDGWEDGFRANLAPDQLAALRPELDSFNALFTAVRKGDVIRIAYRPGTGTGVSINNELRGTVEGNDFFRALLKVWLGDRPVSKSLKQGMLGID